MISQAGYTAKVLLTPPNMKVRRDGDGLTTYIEKNIDEAYVYIEGASGIGAFAVKSKRATYPVYLEGNVLLLAQFLEDAAKQLRILAGEEPNAASSQQT